MTRINTNVSSLVGRNNLAQANSNLSQSLTRLSTGLRINTGADDPAGLIASENLRSDITSIQRAIGNTDRANQVIATADSALGQVSSLLNDIRGLVTESANAGALSDEQIAANQLQVDSSLEALNRIAQTTTFQGRRLLDGSLDFLTSSTDNEFSNITNLQIDQANLGATGSVDVDIDVSAAATQAQVDVTNVPATTITSTGTLDIQIGAVASDGTLSINLAQTEASGTFVIAGETFDVAALAGGAVEGATGNSLTIALVDDDNGNASGSAITSAAVAGTTLTITGDFSADSSLTAGDFATQVNTAVGSGGTGDVSFALAGGGNAGAAVQTSTITSQSYTGGRDASVETIDIDGANAGTSGNIDITIVEDTGVGATPAVTGNAGIGYTVTIDDTAATTISAIAGAINGITEVNASTTSTASYDGGADTAPALFQLTNGSAATTESIDITSATNVNSFDITIVENTGVGATPAVTGDATNGYQVSIDDAADTSITAIASAIQTQIAEVSNATTTSTANFNGTADSAPATLSLVEGATGGLTQAVTFELAGIDGAEVLSFGAGTSISDLVAGINLVSDATGVSATENGTTLEFRSTAYGSDAFVDVSVIEDDSALFTDSRDEGTDVVASVNGVVATGDGNDLSINTATLDLSATLAADFVGEASFTITGGGALFQLGPDVVSNQQARLGIGSVNTARLGGTEGQLFQLGSGGDFDLSTDATTAARIVEDAIDQVTSLRGRLGAFQRTSLETNRNALNDTLTNLTEAESSIRDADFAAETASLTRSQILVQSGTRVLAIANQNPQNVLALLG
ncbi:MAG: flagellin [Planctomycetota bacterium]